ncbi:MAG: amino acid racemase [Nanoarchaeota archaeon]|nr:amino acid racemase [Nanoarchaeota archaeon]MBU1029730.1 amino acid racemase [Nanoarchaeota archaeon]MBU1849171.1 amino acid racemase [Nanoarchaeota archaeon]
MSSYRTIGILGGMGPEATMELYRRIIRIFQRDYNAVYDNDFPEIIILNLPIPDVVENSEQNQIVKLMLVNGSKRLESAGADFIAIPCNTVSLFLKDIKKEVSIPLLNIVKETTNSVKNEKIGLLGTETTIREGFYQKYLKNLILPSKKEQKLTTKVIMNVLAGKKKQSDNETMMFLVKSLFDKGAEEVILGCTELPLIYNGTNCIDTIDVLAKAIVREAVANQKLYKPKPIR